jgi:hypothetical protein
MLKEDLTALAEERPAAFAGRIDGDGVGIGGRWGDGVISGGGVRVYGGQ